MYGINFFEQNGDYLAVLNTISNPENSWQNEESREQYRQLALEI